MERAGNGKCKIFRTDNRTLCKELRHAEKTVTHVCATVCDGLHAGLFLRWSQSLTPPVAVHPTFVTLNTRRGSSRRHIRRRIRRRTAPDPMEISAGWGLGSSRGVIAELPSARSGSVEKFYSHRDSPPAAHPNTTPSCCFYCTLPLLARQVLTVAQEHRGGFPRDAGGWL